MNSSAIIQEAQASDSDILIGESRFSDDVWDL